MTNAELPPVREQAIAVMGRVFGRARDVGIPNASSDVFVACLYALGEATEELAVVVDREIEVWTLEKAIRKEEEL